MTVLSFLLCIQILPGVTDIIQSHGHSGNLGVIKYAVTSTNQLVLNIAI